MIINIYIAGHNGVFLRYSSEVVPSNGDEILLSNGRIVVNRRAFFADKEVVSLLCTPENSSFTTSEKPSPFSNEEFEKLIDKLFEK